MRNFDIKIFLKTFFITIISVLLVLTLVFGLAVADNAFRLTSDLYPLNKLYFNRNNYILCMSLFGQSANINLSALAPDELFQNPVQPLIVGVCACFGAVKSLIQNAFDA